MCGVHFVTAVLEYGGIGLRGCGRMRRIGVNWLGICSRDALFTYARGDSITEGSVF